MTNWCFSLVKLLIGDIGSLFERGYGLCVWEHYEWNNCVQSTPSGGMSHHPQKILKFGPSQVISGAIFAKKKSGLC